MATMQSEIDLLRAVADAAAAWLLRPVLVLEVPEHVRVLKAALHAAGYDEGATQRGVTTSRWIAVRERLPEAGTHALATVAGMLHSAMVVACYGGRGLWYTPRGRNISPDYWMPLPDPPCDSSCDSSCDTPTPTPPPAPASPAAAQVDGSGTLVVMTEVELARRLSVSLSTTRSRM